MRPHQCILYKEPHWFAFLLWALSFFTPSAGNYIAGRGLMQRKDVSLFSGSNFCLVCCFNCHNILKHELHSRLIFIASPLSTCNVSGCGGEERCTWQADEWLWPVHTQRPWLCKWSSFKETVLWCRPGKHCHPASHQSSMSLGRRPWLRVHTPLDCLIYFDRSLRLKLFISFLYLWVVVLWLCHKQDKWHNSYRVLHWGI